MPDSLSMEICRRLVARFWQELWEMDLDRAFTYDFEEYQDDSMEETCIHMYIALNLEEVAKYGFPAKSFVHYVEEQLTDAGEITCRKMFGDMESTAMARL